jgi:simple sugar transport system permease protein
MLRVERREAPPRHGGWAIPLLAVAAAVAVGSLFLVGYGADPVAAWGEIIGGGFGSLYALSETVVKAIPLMLCALGLSVAFRGVVWNIGAEGQLYLGALAAAGAVRILPDSPAWVLIPAMMVAAMLAGGAWAAGPGALKARFGVNEIIVTLMLNYVAFQLFNHLVYGPWRDPKSYGFPFTPTFPEAGWLPVLGTTRIHLGLLFAVVVAILLHLFIRRTTFGFRLRLLGGSCEAARYAGVPLGKTVVAVMAFSGGMAGLAGMAEVAGIQHHLQPGFSPGYGFAAIIVAWLGKLEPLGIVVVSILFGGLLVGTDSAEIMLRLPSAVADVIQALVLLFLITGEFFLSYRVRWIRPAAGGEA